MRFTDILPYIVSIVTAIISGMASYVVSKRKFKEDIKRLEKKHELDIEKEREHFKMEKEKMELEHNYQIELMKKEAENKIGGDVINTIVSTVMQNPEMQAQILNGVKNGIKDNAGR